MSRRKAETMTEVRIDVSRPPGITDKFKRIMERYSLRYYSQVVLLLVNDRIKEINRQERLEQRRRPTA